MVDDDELRPEPPIPPELLDWPVVEPPEGFAQRTAAAFLEGRDRAKEGALRPGSRRIAVALAGVAAVAAAVLLWSRWDPPGPKGDEVVAEVTRTLAIGERAIAVAKAGAALEWRLEDDAVRVEQSDGSVFYRVDGGGPFSVRTPVGTVTVTGTCFEVEVDSMTNGRSWRAGLAGAALATAVVVTVYEGRVVLANERGEVALEASERGVASDDASPRRLGPEDDVAAAGVSAELRRQSRALEQARSEAQASAREVERLRRQVTELGGDAGTSEDRTSRLRRCMGDGSQGGDCPFLEPDEEMLLEMARCGTIKVDLPAFLDNFESPEMTRYAGELGMSDPGEIAALQRAADKHYEEYNARMRELFVELGGEPTMAQAGSAAMMKAFMKDQLDREVLGEVQRRIAEERAGLRSPPTDLSKAPIEEQVLRLHADLGNRFEALIAAEVGAERARELRRKNDGWPGSTAVYSGTCPE